MVTIPAVDEILWERVARDFDNVGPEACMAEIVDDLLAQNPHYLEIAMRCARDTGHSKRVLIGFAMFYQILALDARDRGTVVPRITIETRDAIAGLIGELGDGPFTLLAVDALRLGNPCLMQMADSFASRFENYLDIVQGFALLYKTLEAQAAIDVLRRPTGAAGPMKDHSAPED